MNQKNLFIYFIFLVILITYYSIFYFSYNNELQDNYSLSSYYFSNDDFFWPLPGFNRISSYFGPRRSPTSGASSVHSGIDIPAPSGTTIYSILSCKIISTSFKGAGGYTIVTESNEYTISYCHVSPEFIVYPRPNY